MIDVIKTPSKHRGLVRGCIQWIATGCGLISVYMIQIGTMAGWDWFVVITGAVGHVSVGLVALARYFGIADAVLPDNLQTGYIPAPPVVENIDSLKAVGQQPSGFAFGPASQQHLEQSSEEIAAVHVLALSISEVDFALIDSKRLTETQRENIRKGVSWSMDSRHLERPLAKAIDHVPWVNGAEDWSWQAFEKSTRAIKRASEILKIPCTHGIDWKGKQRDGAHTELDRDYYPYVQATPEQLQPDINLPT